jgi:UDP-N-acetyl-2-amino-2-deoxyglucuronate dehydrogenase
MGMLNYGLIGIGGYIAPRHIKAIKETGGNLSVAYDVNDSVGIIDQFFPNAEFFLKENEFENYIKKSSKRPDFISICTPNYLHKRHITLALNNGCNAICEKPVVISIADLDELQALEKESGCKIFTILQLRRHQMLLDFKKKLIDSNSTKKKTVDLTYITGRGNWYQASWKGNDEMSGGISTNIGVHLFDLLIWLFGKVENCEVHIAEKNKISGILELEGAYVRWFLSIDFDDIPENLRGIKTTYRSILIDDRELEFSEGFTDLHTTIYKDIIEGNGIGIEAARDSISLVSRINSMGIKQNPSDLHPMAKKLLKR